jgi:hypothetical protein
MIQPVSLLASTSNPLGCGPSRSTVKGSLKYRYVATMPHSLCHYQTPYYFDRTAVVLNAAREAATASIAGISIIE